MRIMGKLVLAIVLLGFIAVSASADDPLTITADGQILISVNGVTRNLAECLAPVGSIQPFAGTTVPQGWLLCDGRAVSRSDFARLYAVIGEAFGQGNGSSTFNLPDMREAAPCGVGTHAAGVMNHDTYDLGQFKDDQMQGHIHTATTTATRSRNGSPIMSGSGSGGDYFPPAGSVTIGDPVADAHGNGQPLVGPVTRGKRIGVNFIIKS